MLLFIMNVNGMFVKVMIVGKNELSELGIKWINRFVILLIILVLDSIFVKILVVKIRVVIVSVLFVWVIKCFFWFLSFG